MSERWRLAGGGDCGVTPKQLSDLLMREEFDQPSPLERLCACALGVLETPPAGHSPAEGAPSPLADALMADAALVDFVTAEQEARGLPPTEYVPPDAFYERFAALLAREYPCH